MEEKKIIKAEGEVLSYWSIVWRQFRKNKLALLGLSIVVLFFLIAIFAPLIASNYPLIYITPEGTSSPWLIHLFNFEFFVDYIFNMAMLLFIPWLIFLIVLKILTKDKWTNPKWLFVGFAVFVLSLIFFSILFKIDLFHPNEGIPIDYKNEIEESEGSKEGYFTIIPFSQREQHLEVINHSPDGQYLCGTDGLGRDNLTRLIYGSRVSLTVGFVAVSIYIVIGIIIGAIAGFFGGWTDIIISRFLEVMMMFPSFFLIITIVAMIGPSIFLIMVVIGCTRWTGVARLIRGEFLRLRNLDFVTASEALGVSKARIIFRHILPNAVAPAFVSATFGVAGAILVESGLSFLGFGVRPPIPSWGAILAEGRADYENWWLLTFSAIAIFITITSYNLVGEGLRDSIDPKMRV